MVKPCSLVQQMVRSASLTCKKRGFSTQFSGLIGHITQIAFSPDGQKIVALDEYSDLNVWNVNGEVLHVLSGFASEIQGLQFQDNGDLAVWGGSDLQTIDPTDGKVRSSIVIPNVKLLAVSQDGLRVAGENDGEMQLWQTVPVIMQASMESPLDVIWARYDQETYYGFFQAAFTADGKYLAASGSGGFTCGPSWILFH